MNRDAALVEFNDLFDDGETDTVTFGMMGLIALIKLVEKLGLFLLGDRIADVGDVNRCNGFPGRFGLFNLGFHRAALG